MGHQPRLLTGRATEIVAEDKIRAAIAAGRFVTCACLTRREGFEAVAAVFACRL